MAVTGSIPSRTAIQMVTINVATYFQMGEDMGSVTPGKCADLVFLEDLKDFRVTRTIIDGEVVAEDGKALRGNSISYGDYAIQALEPCWMTANQFS